MNPVNSNPWLVPSAIIIGFSLLALAIFFTDRSDPVRSPSTDGAAVSSEGTGRIRPVDDTDFIKGNPNAPILIVEYSDYDCPFCKNFHETMTRIMEEYGVTGRVAWVYRQLPLTELHPNSARISMNALCVGKLGGNEAFWKFTDQIFEERNLLQPTNITRLPTYAENAGVGADELIRCLEDPATKDRLARDVADAVNVGFNATPHSFVIVGNQIAPIEGAQDYSVVKSIIDDLLRQLEGGTTSS